MSILQPWVERIGLRHQGVIVSAMRGCDIAPRHDISKRIQRLLRGAIVAANASGQPVTIVYIDSTGRLAQEIVIPNPSPQK